MSRSEKLKARFLRRFWISAVCLLVAIAVCCWSAGVTPESPLGGVALLAVALVGLAASIDQFLEGLHDLGIYRDDLKITAERSIRPRI